MSTNFKRHKTLEDRQAELKAKQVKSEYYWIVRARVARLCGAGRALALTKSERVAISVKASKAASASHTAFRNARIGAEAALKTAESAGSASDPIKTVLPE